MNSKERVMAAVYLETPDRVPISAERLSTPILESLLRHFGFEFHRNSRECYQNCLRLHEKLGLDVILREAKYKTFGLGNGYFKDEWGVVLRSMKSTGEAHVVDYPLKTYGDIESYIPPDPRVPQRYTPISQAVKAYGDRYAIMGGFGPCLFEKAYNLRGLANLLGDFYKKPGAVRKLFEKIAAHRVIQAEIIVDMGIDIFYIGEDYGMQEGLMLSPTLWRKMVKPYLKRILKVPVSKGIPVFIHSCGNIGTILEDLIEVGVSILNPVQPKAMDPAHVKEEFGDRICLFGTLDVQHTLPFGTPEDVRDEVKQRIQTLASGGGLILAPAHTVLPEVPLGNVLSFVETAREYGKYPIDKRFCA